jgi:hypothetical protein
MLISVQDDLKDIKKYLEAMGYDVHNLSENLASDIYIYSESSMGFMNLYNNTATKDEGSYIINGDNKSINELLYSINHRTYTPLF